MLPKAELRRRLAALRALMRKKNLDAILLYGHPAEDLEYARWLTGTSARHFSNYILITDSEELITEIRWAADDLVFRSAIKSIIPVASGEGAAAEVTKRVAGIRRLGIVGLAPYVDMAAIAAEKVDISRDVEELMMIKSAWEIGQIKRACRAVIRGLTELRIRPGMAEQQIAAAFEFAVISRGFECRVKNQPSVVAGRRLAVTTLATPSLYRLRRGDIVCIDTGATWNGYNSDITRCFVVGRSKWFRYYEALAKVQDAVIAKLRPGMVSSDLLSMYRAELEKHGLARYLVPIDLGHGIGCGHHEKPDIGEDDTVLRAGMVFTVEPELNLKATRVRIEDVVALTARGARKLS